MSAGQFINQHSFTIVGGAALILLAVALLRDGIEQEHGSRLRVIRLNIQDRAGEQLAARFGLQFTPTFVLLNAKGEVIGRWAGALDPGQVRVLLESP